MLFPLCYPVAVYFGRLCDEHGTQHISKNKCRHDLFLEVSWFQFLPATDLTRNPKCLPPVVVHNPTWKPARLVLPHPLSDPKPRCESLRDKTCQIYPNVISLLAARSPRAVACNKGSLFPELVVFGLQPQSLDPTSPISNPILQARNRNPPAYMEPNTKTVGPPNTTSLGSVVRRPSLAARL
jgi:hypothetical protein